MSDVEFREKIKTVRFGRERKQIPPKKTVDVHDHHTVEVTEHWEERQDVNVKPETIRMKLKGKVHGSEAWDG